MNLILAYPLHSLGKVRWIGRQNVQDVIFMRLYNTYDAISLDCIMAYFICQKICKKSVIKDFLAYRNRGFCFDSVFQSSL